MQQETEDRRNDILQRLQQQAQNLGATRVRIISAADVAVESGLAEFCHDCPKYGLSKSCPPHVSGPSELKAQLAAGPAGIFFRIDVPADLLLSSSRTGLSTEHREVFQLLHQIASGVGQKAVALGGRDVQAFAGGSCKHIFCHDYPDCRALSENGICRNPDHARPSMSGFGINVTRLFATCGWKMQWEFCAADGTVCKMASVCGLVLVRMP